MEDADLVFMRNKADLKWMIERTALKCELEMINNTLFEKSDKVLNDVFRNVATKDQVNRFPTAEELLGGLNDN